VMAQMPELQLVLLVGRYAQKWHLGAAAAKAGLSQTVRDWRTHCEVADRPAYLPLPHPSWRNTGWLKRNPWFEAEVVPALRARIGQLL